MSASRLPSRPSNLSPRGASLVDLFGSVFSLATIAPDPLIREVFYEEMGDALCLIAESLQKILEPDVRRFRRPPEPSPTQPIDESGGR